MKAVSTLIGLLLLLVISGGVWVLRFHSNWIQPTAADEGDDEAHDTLIPVHVAKIERATMRRYIESFGTVEPSPARGQQPAGTADIASPVPGVVAEVLCQAGQKVTKGTLLIQLDDRLAKAAQEQAAAALASAKASLAKLKATPRPEQLEIARLAVTKAQAAVQFTQKNLERQKGLAANQGTSQKTLETAEQDAASAKTDLATAELQYALLKASPTPEELADETAKVAAAEAALAAATTQREMLKIVAPMDATVSAVLTHAGEAVDNTHVIIDLVALDRLVVNASVPAEAVAALAAGQAVHVFHARDENAKSPQPACEGKVYLVGPEVDPKTGTVPVGIDIPAGSPLRPGQAVRVRILVEEHKDVLAVPREAVVQNDNGDSVIGIIDKDQAMQKMVRAGIREGNLVEIDADGLKEGDSVVAAGLHGMPQATKIKVVEN